MYTYQDLLEVDKTDDARMQFARSVIADHQSSEVYQTALVAEDYDKRKNRTITEYRKVLYTLSGREVPDNVSANYKICSNFFDYFVTQQNQYLLGNGVTWQKEDTYKKLGDDFDEKMEDLSKKAQVEGVAFGFFNNGSLEVFGLSEFAPLYDEETGALKAGVRFWQIDKTKPLRATLYELDGYTEFIWRDNKPGEVLQPKQNYVYHTETTEKDGTEIVYGENYPTFPIVPLWSRQKQSELVGLRENIDAYDLIKSGFANDLDDTSQIYWIIKNAGGMDESDLVQFLNRMHRVHVATTTDDADIEAHSIDVPYNAREALLTRLREDLFEIAMAFDPKKLASGGSVVTSAIKAAFIPLDEKTDEYERCVTKFLRELAKVAGIEDEPSYSRSRMINETEQINNLVQSAQYLPSEYVTRKILGLLGDGAMADKLIKEMDKEDEERLLRNSDQTGETDDGEMDDDQKKQIADNFRKSANGGSGQHLDDGTSKTAG